MDIKHYIRLIGDHHATHHSGTVLGVTEDETRVAANRNLVHLAHARELVAKGGAEWVGLAAAEAPGTRAEHIDRHRTEHAALLARHTKEHQELMKRHAEEHRQAFAGAGLAAALTGI